MAPKRCGQCGGTDLETDHQLGQVTCSECGCVVEKGILVSEVGFAEGSGGRVHVQGTFVGHLATGLSGLRSRNAGESSENVKRGGQEKIQAVARDMGLGAGIANGATRSFSLLVDQRFNKGRKTDYLVASCLYLQCRLMKEPYMLIDFSERLQVNVFELAGTYLKLRAILMLDKTMPEVDPAIYNIHFARRLSLGPKAQVVAADASRLVRRFKADWMTQGRRPAGICGACLIIASRMSNFLRTAEEVAQVVKCSPTTIRMRLREFAMTQMALRTVKEWRGLTEEELDAVGEDVPPIVKWQRAQAAKKEAEQRAERDAADASAAAGDGADDDNEGGTSLSSGKKRKAKGKGRDVDKDSGRGSKRKKRKTGSEMSEVEDNRGGGSTVDMDEAIRRAAEEMEADGDDGQWMEEEFDLENDDLLDISRTDLADDLATAGDNPEQALAVLRREKAAFQRDNRQITKGFIADDLDLDELASDVVGSDADGAVNGETGLAETNGVGAEANEKEDADVSPATQLREMTQPDFTTLIKTDDFSNWGDSAETLSHFTTLYFAGDPKLAGLKAEHLRDRVSKWLPPGRDPQVVAWECQVVDAAHKRREWEARESREEVIEGLDEDELDEYWVLDERDKQLRASVWLSQNGKWLEQNKIKEEEKAAWNKAHGIDANHPPKPKRKRGAPAGPRQPFKSARDAIEGFASQKKFSNRINYGALRGFGFDGDVDESGLQKMDDEKDDDEGIEAYLNPEAGLRSFVDDDEKDDDNKDDEEYDDDDDKEEDPSSYW